MALPKPNALSWLGLSALLIVADQASKAWAVASLVYREPVPVIEGFWNWTLVHNYGAAFSFLSDAGGWQRWFFAGLAAVVSVVLVVLLARTARSNWRDALPYALVVAGALGNLVDRIRYGYVVDFIDWYAGSYHWPAFNVADSAIVVGAVLLVLFSFKAPAKAGEGG